MSAPAPWRLDATALAAEIRHGRLTARQALDSILERTLSANLRVNALPLVLLEETRAARPARLPCRLGGAGPHA